MLKQVSKLSSWFVTKGKKTKEHYVERVIGAERIREQHRYIKKLSSNLRPNPGTIANETFGHAKLRLGLTPEKLKKAHDAMSNQILVMLFFMIFSLGISFYQLVVGEIMWSLSLLAFFAVCSSVFFKHSFRCYQIRRGELVPPKEWLANPREWIGGVYEIPKKKKLSELR